MAIVISHLDTDLDRLLTRALRQAKLADLVELRLDAIGNPGEERLGAFCRECPKPVIVTVHGPEAFGDFSGEIDERLDILHTAARAGARFVDIDWRLSLALGEVERPCHRIVSRHETEGTPEDLEALHEQVREVLYEGDVTKLVTHATCVEDGLRMLAHVRANPGLVGFCSGEAGAFTRVIAPIVGSAFTYAAPADLPGLGGGPPTAPGQIRVNDLLAMFPPGGISPETAVFGVLGSHARTSFSPRVHGMAFKAAGIDAVYLSFEPNDIDRFLDLAVDEVFRGFSVTMPFKRAALARASTSDATSRAIGAANTLLRERSGWRAANTDAPAVRETLERALEVHARRGGAPTALAGARVLVLGAGGAAAAAAHAVREAGAAVAIAARRFEAAEALAARCEGRALRWDQAPSCEHDILVHTTPLGSLAAPGELAFPEEAIRPGSVVLDAVYRPLRTPLLEAAARRGATAVPGGEWFVRQAALQFRLFVERDPDEALLRAAFEHAHEAAGLEAGTPR